MNTHDGTHVNAPVHAISDGKTLDGYSLESFCGEAHIYNPEISLDAKMGVIFIDQNIDQKIAEEIKKIRPRFVGLCTSYEFDENIEKELLKEDLVLFERLTNLEQLPEKFMFYGMPLKIKDGDGSPVRAFAILS